MNQFGLWLDTFLQNDYWRMAIIVFAAILVAVMLRFLLLPLLMRLSRRTASKLDDRVFELLWPALWQTVILEGIYIASVGFVEEQSIAEIVLSANVTLLVLIWGRFVVRSGDILLRGLSEHSGKFRWIQPQTLPLAKFILKIGVFGVATYLVMSTWHVNLTSWIASAGVVGIAVGFAAKDTLANFIAGIFILADAPYKVGEYIIIDDVTRGEVTEIGLRSTRLLTRNNVEVSVPNAVISNAKIVNESSGPSTWMRIQVNVSVAYGSDVDQVREILHTCLDQIPQTVGGQPSAVRFMAMADSGLEFQILVWISHPAYRGRVIDDINTRVYKALNAAGISIPFPQRDLHIKEWPAPPPTGSPRPGPTDTSSQ